MEELGQTEEKTFIQLSSNFRVSSNERNVILQEKYETSISRGKNAPKSGEFAYRDIGYYGSIEALSNDLVNREILKSLDEVKDFSELMDKLIEIKEDIFNKLTEHITIDLGLLTEKLRKIKGKDDDLK